MQRLALLLLLLSAMALSGCAYGGYGLYDDQRLMDTITADRKLSAKIKTALINESFSGGWAVAVYSYYSQVFLVGQIPPDMQEKALTIARRYKPRSVTAHWFEPATSETGDISLAASLRARLIGTKGLSSSRVDTEVNSGRVVLLGVVKDDSERHLAIETAQKTPNVTLVTSYLLLPLTGHGLPDHSQNYGPIHGHTESGGYGGQGGIESRDL